MDAGYAQANDRALAARRYAAAAGVLVGLMGAIALTGWLSGLPVPASVVPGAVTMKANTAIGFLATAVALVARASMPNERLRRVGTTAALLVLAIGALTITEYAFGVDLRIDQMVFDELPPQCGPPTPAGWRSTALCASR